MSAAPGRTLGAAAPATLPADWPNRAHSRSVDAGGLRWHVQLAGQGPVLLLLHGTGGACHSWAEMLPTLARHATVLAPDLPGHGYTRGATPEQLTLPGMAQTLTALLAALGLPPPSALAGHSAGAALALRWALQHAQGQPRPTDAAAPAPVLLGFAPSLVAPPELYTRWLAPLVNPLATSSAVAAITARLAASTSLVDGLLNSTGSALTPEQRARYRQLFEDPAHVRGAVGFMAAADLPALLQASHALRGPMAFVLGQQDAWVPTQRLAPVIAQHLPRAEVQHWAGGHLVHEEQPARAAQWVLSQLPWVRAAVTPAGS